MSNALLASLDADLHAAFAGAGMADVATFTPRAVPAVGEDPPAEPVPVTGCRVYVDRDTATLAARGIELRRGAAVVILLRHPDIALQPGRGDTLLIDGDTFHVEDCIDSDESRWELACRS
jgi:hypothetical protein